MKELHGKWNYQSFASVPADVDRSKTPPTVKRPALIAGPWAPQSVMEFATDSAGNVTGSVTLGPLSGKITGSIKPAVDGIPEGIELVVTIEKTSSVYNLRGFFLEDSNHIIGSVVAISNDLGFQPVGTSGPFVLYPASA